MTKKQLIATILGSLSAIIAALAIYFGVSSTTPPPVEDDPTPDPVDAQALILDSLGRPEWSQESQWKTSVSRTVLGGQPTGFFVRTETPCELVRSDISVVRPIEVVYPSANQYEAGTYYDALETITEENCKDAVNLWIEVPGKPDGTTEIDVLGANLVVEYVGQADEVAPVPLYAEMNPISLQYGYCGTMSPWTQCNNDAQYQMKQPLELAIAHRVYPYKHNIKPWNGSQDSDDQLGYFQNVIPYSPAKTFVPNGTPSTAAASSLQGRQSWFYLADEPTANQLPGIRNQIAEIREGFPEAELMVTTTIEDDLDLDIFCPVFEEFGVRGHPGAEAYAGKELWLYVSCMSTGCGYNRAWRGGALEPLIHNETGAPSLTIDAEPDHIYAFFLVGHSLGGTSLLHYNMMEGWGLWQYGVDVWTDQYNFGDNGDGTFLYPDRVAKEARPSVRLKLLREASYTVEMMIKAGHMDRVKAFYTDALHWNISLDDVEHLRTEALEAL